MRQTEPAGAIGASGAEITHILQLDLADQTPAAQADLPRTVFQSDTHEIEYRKGGQLRDSASCGDLVTL